MTPTHAIAHHHISPRSPVENEIKTKESGNAANKTLKTRNGAPCGGSCPPPTPFPRDRKERTQGPETKEQKDQRTLRAFRRCETGQLKDEKDQEQKNNKGISRVKVNLSALLSSPSEFEAPA